MKPEVLLIVNLVLVNVFILLLRKKAFLTYCQRRKVWLTGLAIAIITPMDELTSLFNAPAEAFHFICSKFNCLQRLLLEYIQYVEVPIDRV